MVKSKKMSKSTIAVIVLSILLVLSLALGVTSAWFTSKENATDNDKSVTFGTVKITSATATVNLDTKKKYVPGDSFTGTVNFVNGSNVKIYYAYDISASMTVDKETTSLGADYVTISGATAGSDVKELAGDAQADATTITFSFANTKEDNKLNGKSAKVVLTIHVYAMQADNIKDKPKSYAELKSKYVA